MSLSSVCLLAKASCCFHWFLSRATPPIWAYCQLKYILPSSYLFSSTLPTVSWVPVCYYFTSLFLVFSHHEDYICNLIIGHGESMYLKFSKETLNPANPGMLLSQITIHVYRRIKDVEENTRAQDDSSQWHQLQ